MSAQKGRCDLHPHLAILERFRYNLIEMILLVMFSVGAFNVEREDKIGLRIWGNSWGLFAFCTHMFWIAVCMRIHQALGGRGKDCPWGAVVTYLFVPLFWLKYKYWDLPKKEAAEKKKRRQQLESARIVTWQELTRSGRGEPSLTPRV